MITYFMCREFTKSGEFDEENNPYAGLEIFFRLPFFVLLDILLVVKIIDLFI